MLNLTTDLLVWYPVKQEVSITYEFNEYYRLWLSSCRYVQQELTRF